MLNLFLTKMQNRTLYRRHKSTNKIVINLKTNNFITFIRVKEYIGIKYKVFQSNITYSYVEHCNGLLKVYGDQNRYN